MLDGIDVSKYQAKIDWKKTTAAAVQPPLAFAICRASYGKTVKDPFFTANWQGALDAGLVAGAYHFFVPASDAANGKTQAKLFLGQVRAACRPGDQNYLPAVLDIELPPGDVPVAQYITGFRHWLALVEADPLFAGMKSILYTSKSAWAALGNPAGFSDRPLWVADYSQNPPRLPKSWSSWSFFQYSESGQRANIGADVKNAAVDLDYFNGGADDLTKMTRGAISIGP